MISLTESRDKLDVIDKEIMRLLEERMDITRDVALYKIHNNMPVLDSSRENQKISMAEDTMKNEDYKEAARKVMITLMEVSRANQKKIIENN